MVKPATKQALMGDVEFGMETVRRYKKMFPNEPVDLALLVGLDAYAFDKGKMSEDEFKEKLLSYKYMDENRVRITSAGKKYLKAGDYNPKADHIRLFQASQQFEREPTPDPDGGTSYKRTPRTEEAGKFVTLIHELKHRGNAFIESLGIPRVGLFELFKYDIDKHSDMDYDDRQMEKALNIRGSLPGLERKGSKKQSKKRKKALKNVYKKNKYLQDRYPSAYTKYNKGGKIYANQPRKVKIRG